MTFEDSYSKNLALSSSFIQDDAKVGMSGQCPSCGSVMLSGGNFLSKDTVNSLANRWNHTARYN